MVLSTKATLFIWLLLFFFLSACSSNEPIVNPNTATPATTTVKLATVVANAQQASPTGTSPSLETLLPTLENTATRPPLASATPLPIATETPTPTPTQIPETPTPSPTPSFINGVPLNSVIVLGPDTRQHVREIYARGQEIGRDPNAFSRLGASLVATEQFLGRFDTGPYDLGPYAYLEPAVENFDGSFSRIGIAALRGLTASAAFDPYWAPEEQCLANETVIDCEIRLHNPSIILISLGTNDKWDTVVFENGLRKLVEHTSAEGVIPVLATKADRFEGEDNRNNKIIRQVAYDYRVPLWDFDLLAGTLLGRGMGSDDVHLTFFDYYDYNMELAYQTGYGLYNLTALMMLDEILQEISD